MEQFELRHLSERLNIPINRLRYVLNEDLVPFGQWSVAKNEVNQPRRFEFITAVFIACAAYLLEAGLKRETVKLYMEAVARVYTPGRNPLHLPEVVHAMMSHSNAVIQIADGIRVRIKLGERDTGWVNPGPPRSADEGYVPKIVVAMDLGQVRDLIRGQTDA